MKAIEAIITSLENRENGTACPLCDSCHDLLTPEQFSECVFGENLCSKSDMVNKQIMFEILDLLYEIKDK